MINFTFDSKGLEEYSNKLMELNRSAFPVAIRGALNDTAFDNKKRTMPQSAGTNFVNRQKNFFIANSKVQPAVGFSINDMKAIVGFYENKLVDQATNFSVKDLDQQENAGQIRGKAFIPLNSIRSGGKGNVRPNARLKALKDKKAIIANNLIGSSKGEKFIKAVFKAGAGGLVLGSTVKGETILWRVNSLSSRIKTKQLDITPLYDYVKGRSVHVNKTGFMRKSGLSSAKKTIDFYASQANKQIAKYYNKK